MADRSHGTPSESDSRTGVDHSAKPCTICGDPVPTDEWHPVVLDSDADRSRVRVFCSQDCRDRWVDA